MIGAFSTESLAQPKESIVPIKAENLPVYSADKLTLGHRLFHERKLSSNEELSCASCHNLDKYTADG